MALCADTPISELIIPGTTLRIIVLCISKITLGVIFYLVEKFLNREHYIKKEEGILLIALYAIFFIVALISIKITRNYGIFGENSWKQKMWIHPDINLT